MASRGTRKILPTTSAAAPAEETHSAKILFREKLSELSKEKKEIIRSSYQRIQSRNDIEDGEEKRDDEDRTYEQVVDDEEEDENRY